MEIKNIKEKLQLVKLNFYYRMWKTRLFKYGGYNRNTNLKILDIGCGEGYFLKCLEEWFPDAELFGVDIFDEKLKSAIKILKRAKLSKHDAQQLPFPDRSFEIVSALQVLEHLKTPEMFFKEANRILKNKSFLIIATPNPNGIAAKILRNKWHGYTEEYISLKTPQELQIIIKNSGFKILEDGTTGITGF